ncbi:MAG: ABC transporter permease subunit [Planctomycetes bacterium]|nr:ABC transporter permease subunit [Planctomycetota bacterium]
MRNLLILTRRELAASFSSFGYYALLGAVAAISGFFFFQALEQGGGDLRWALVGSSGFIFWLALILAPLLTMRLFAEERKSGSLELLMTAPVDDWEVVLAKYLGALVVFTTFFAPFWLAHLVLALFFDGPVDWGQLSATTLGFSTVALIQLAIGLMASALVSQQLWAALFAFLGNMALYSLGLLRLLCEEGSRTWNLLGYVDIGRHVQTGVAGLVDLRQVLLQVSVTLLLLFWTVRIVEVRKWR